MGSGGRWTFVAEGPTRGLLAFCHTQQLYKISSVCPNSASYFATKKVLFSSEKNGCQYISAFIASY